LPELERLKSSNASHSSQYHRFRTAESSYAKGASKQPLQTHLSAAELALFQQLGKSKLVFTQPTSLPYSIDTPVSSTLGTTGAMGGTPHILWLKIERLLRQYAQYHFDRPIRSAALIDSCFASSTYVS
jgi:DNA repair protein RecO (recombination protein O)